MSRARDIVTVDLTSSFEMDHHNCVMNDTIIEINDSDTPIYHSNMKDSSNPRKRRGRPKKVNQNQEDKSEPSPKKAKRSRLECPICLDEMLNKPLASTKCGHVFCMQCLKKSLKTQKNCPKCRQVLTGSKAYHPVYLF